MTYFEKPTHSYHKIIFEFTNKEMKDAGLDRIDIKSSQFELLQLLQKISDKQVKE